MTATRMQMFHGTTADAHAQIMASGALNGPVYLTPKRAVAEDYAESAEFVIDVQVDPAHLKIDLDMPGGRLMTVDEASKYLGRDLPTIEAFVAAGYSVATECDVAIR